MNQIISTLVIPFGESIASDDGDVIAEWDDTMNITAEGEIKSQFLPNDKAYLLVHSPNVELKSVKATHGVVNHLNNELIKRSDNLGFGFPNEIKNLSYTPDVVIESKWFGNIGQNLNISGKEVKVGAGEFPCLVQITYYVPFSRYVIQLPDLILQKDETYPILVYIYYVSSAA